MWSLAKFSVLLFMTSAVCDANIQSIHTYQPLSRHLSGLSFNLTSNSSASPTVTTEKPRSSHLTPSTNTSATTRFGSTRLASTTNRNATERFKTSHLSHTTNTSDATVATTENNTTSLPPPFYFLDQWGTHLKNFNHIKAGFCDLGDAFCFFRNPDGTMTKANPTSLEDMCVLWDSACSGDRTKAIEKFFRSTVDFGGNPCFEQTPGGDSSACVTYNPRARLLEWEKIKRWMRSLQCSSALDSYEELRKKNHGTPDRFYPDVSTCCLRCYIQAANVDLYYWPEPDADTSCLSIIGGSVRPLDYGATTATVSVLHQLTQRVDTVTYWGCIASTLKTDTLSSKGHLTTWYSRETITTAQITTIGSLTVKHSAFNPWSSAPCPQEDTASQVSAVKVKPRALNQSMVIPPSTTQKNDLPATVVSDGYTFISPSVYARFDRIQAYDGCEQTTIPPMMLSFAPGQLSTIQGPISVPAQLKNSMILNVKKPFNAGDLPCPPQSVMEANWYKPAPGEPYRPLIAMPDQLGEKLREIDPRLSSCQAAFFTAFDPPRALMPMSSLLPAEPAGEPKPAPVPSPTDSFGASETIAGQGAAAKPPSVPTVDQPKATIDPALVLTNESPATQHHSDDPVENDVSPPQEQHSPGDPITEHNQGSGDGSGKDPNTDNNQGTGGGSGNDPDKGIDPAQSKEVNVNDEQIAGLNSNTQSGSTQIDTTGQVNDKPANINSPVNLIGMPSSSDPSHDSILAGGAPAPADPVTTINNQIIQPLSHGISVAGTTLTPGAPAITASGTSISLGSSALIVGPSTVPIHFHLPDPFITTIAGHAITAAPSAVDVAGTTLHPGVPGVTFDGTAVSLDTASHLVIGSNTISLNDQNKGPARLILGGVNDPSSPGVAEPFITTMAGHAITAAPNAVDIAGTTLHPGDPGIAVDGTTMSLDPTHHLIIGSKTIPLTSESVGLGRTILGGLAHPSASDNDDDVAEPLITTIAGHTITAGPNAVEIAGSKILHPGDPAITLDGTLAVSLDSSHHLILGSSTIALLPTVSPLGKSNSGASSGGDLPLSNIENSDDGVDTDPFITTIANQPITAAPTALAFAGTTLTPGAAGQTINGTLVSLNAAGQLVVGEKTIALDAGLAFSPSSFSGISVPSSSALSSSNGSGNVTDMGRGGGVRVFEGSAGRRGLAFSTFLVVMEVFVGAVMAG